MDPRLDSTDKIMQVRRNFTNYKCTAAADSFCSRNECSCDDDCHSHTVKR